MVGGITAFIGAAMLGPRIGKYDKNGKPRPILGHNILIGALGVFILWFGWYGFNGAAATDTMQLSQIFATTTVAPAVATCTAMIYTWIRNGKPDVSMSLNGSLAGLVAVTAGCANVDVIGSFIIGAIAGVLVCVAVYFVEDKLKVDDPVGAVAVHGCNGIWGTIAVGLFDYKDGLFYGGGVHHLLLQLLGILCIAGWTIITMGIVFTVLKKTIGLRVTAQEEIEGLDSTEHGLESGYPDFVSREPSGFSLLMYILTKGIRFHQSNQIRLVHINVTLWIRNPDNQNQWLRDFFACEKLEKFACMKLKKMKCLGIFWEFFIINPIY